MTTVETNSWEGVNVLVEVLKSENENFIEENSKNVIRGNLVLAVSSATQPQHRKLGLQTEIDLHSKFELQFSERIRISHCNPYLGF